VPVVPGVVGVLVLVALGVLVVPAVAGSVVVVIVSSAES